MVHFLYTCIYRRAAELGRILTIFLSGSDSDFCNDLQREYERSRTLTTPGKKETYTINSVLQSGWGAGARHCKRIFIPACRMSG